MAVTYAVIQGVARNVGDGIGTTDYTSSGFGTPDAAMVVLNRAYSGGNPNNTAALSVGFLDGTDQSCNALFCEHNVGTTNTQRAHSTANCAGYYAGGWILQSEGSIITDGVQIDWTNVAGFNYYVTIYLFKGLSNAKAFSEQITTTGVNDITSIGFKSHLVLFTSIGHSTAPDSGASNANISFGAAHNNSSDVVSQGMFMFGSQDAQPSSVCSLSIRDDCCVGEILQTSITWKGSAENFDSSGFSIDTGSDSPGNSYIFGLAIQLDSADDASIDIIDTPTSAGTQAYTDPGLLPLGLILGQTNAATINTIHTTGAAGGFSIGSADGTNEYSLGISDDDGATTTDTQADANLTNVAQHYFDNGGSTSYIAFLDSFDANGFTLDFTDTGGLARKILAIAIKGEIVPSGEPLAAYLPTKQFALRTPIR